MNSYYLSPGRRYTVHYDRPVRDNYSIFTQTLAGLGKVRSFGNPNTTLEFRPFRGVKLLTIKTAILNCLDPRRGSVVISAHHSGRRYRVNNRGNKPGRFLKK